MKRRQQGLEANPEQDARLRAAAEAIATEITHLAIDMTRERGAMDMIAEHGGAGLSLQLPPAIARAAGIEPFQFSVIFTPEGVAGANVPASFSKADTTIQLHMLPSWAPDAAKKRERYRVLEDYVWDQLGRYHSYIVHEATHMLDAQRAERMFERPPPRPPQGIVSDAELRRYAKRYLNDPVEFNAFFQQIVSEASDILKRTPPDIQQQVLSDFNFFRQLIGATRSYLNAAPGYNKKYNRKLHTRLWQTWKHWHDRAAEQHIITPDGYKLEGLGEDDNEPDASFALPSGRSIEVWSDGPGKWLVKLFTTTHLEHQMVLDANNAPAAALRAFYYTPNNWLSFNDRNSLSLQADLMLVGDPKTSRKGAKIKPQLDGAACTIENGKRGCK